MPLTRRAHEVAAAAILLLRKKRTKRRTIRVRQWLLKREEYGAYRTLLPEFKFDHVQEQRKFLRTKIFTKI